MKAVLNTSCKADWAGLMGDEPWALLPVANRPLLDYWLEACVDLGIHEVQLVLGEGARQIEDYVRTGDRWGLRVDYAFSRKGESPRAYLKTIAAHYDEGLFYIGTPFFLRRRKAFTVEGCNALRACRHDDGGRIAFLQARNKAELDSLLEQGSGDGRGLEQIHIHPYMIHSIQSYFDLNMKMSGGELSRYLEPGWTAEDGSSIGSNVITLPSSQLEAPIVVGDNCSFGALTSIGPRAVIANHVIVDKHSELNNCLILSDTYIGTNLEIKNKIVSGNRVIDPVDGTVVEIPDSWMVARNRPEMRMGDRVRHSLLWLFACGLVVVQFIPFFLMLAFLRITKVAGFVKRYYHDPLTGYIALPVFGKLKNRKCIVYRFFRGLSLDRFPWLLLVLRGRLFLCGQPPMRHPEDDKIVKRLTSYYPGVFCYLDYNADADRLIDSEWYAKVRSLYEDVKILVKSLVYRFVTAGR